MRPNTEPVSLLCLEPSSEFLGCTRPWLVDVRRASVERRPSPESLNENHWVRSAISVSSDKIPKRIGLYRQLILDIKKATALVCAMASYQLSGQRLFGWLSRWLRCRCCCWLRCRCCCWLRCRCCCWLRCRCCCWLRCRCCCWLRCWLGCCRLSRWLSCWLCCCWLCCRCRLFVLSLLATTTDAQRQCCSAE